jgi:hypothetical protein
MIRKSIVTHNAGALPLQIHIMARGQRSELLRQPSYSFVDYDEHHCHRHIILSSSSSIVINRHHMSHVLSCKD